MDLSAGFLVLILGMAVLAVILGRWLGRRRILGNRELLDLDEAYRRYMAEYGVSFELFEQVSNKIGELYRIDPRLLRPSDRLKDLYKIDSWDLGMGTEKLNEILEDEFSIVDFKFEPETIAELVVAIEQKINR